METATMLRAARLRAGLTQSDLAQRGKTSAPTISAYEHGARHPRADVLLRLLAAAGAELAVVPSGGRRDRYIDLLCDELARRVREDPGILATVRTELDRMIASANRATWVHLLNAGPAAVIAVLTSHDPDVRGLKADNPFVRLDLVDEDTRLALLEQAHAR